jgi:hypothetical protein
MGIKKQVQKWLTGRLGWSQTRTFHVDPSGSDASAGSSFAPWRTIRKGLTSLYPGDALIIHGGLYTENIGGDTPAAIRPGTSSLPITVMPAPGERPVLQGLLWLRGASYWTVSGLNVTWKPGNLITNAEVWGANSYAGILVASMVTGEPAGWRIAGCAVHDTKPTHSTNQDHCIYVNTGSSPGGVIEHNLLYNATNGEGVKLGGADTTQLGPQNIVVRYNTIYNTAQSILIAWSAKNNLIYGNLMQRVGANYGCIRGYQLSGSGNRANANAGYQARLLILNDAGYHGVEDAGGNIFPLDPQFASIEPFGFHPQNPAAQSFGRYATP